MFQDVCAFVGAAVLNLCQAAGRMMLLFIDTLSKIREVNIREMLRQMAVRQLQVLSSLDVTNLPSLPPSIGHD